MMLFEGKSLVDDGSGTIVIDFSEFLTIMAWKMKYMDYGQSYDIVCSSLFRVLYQTVKSKMWLQK